MYSRQWWYDSFVAKNHHKYHNTPEYHHSGIGKLAEYFGEPDDEKSSQNDTRDASGTAENDDNKYEYRFPDTEWLGSNGGHLWCQNVAHHTRHNGRQNEGDIFIVGCIDAVSFGSYFIITEIIQGSTESGIFQSMKEKNSYGHEKPDIIKEMLGLPDVNPQYRGPPNSDNSIGTVGNAKNIIHQGDTDNLGYRYGRDA